MARFVVFLRGINVGGRIVKKEVLRETFETLGFEDVTTFRQSGNVIFETCESKPEAIREKIEPALRKKLGYEVAVFVQTLPSLRSLVALDPFKGRKDKDASFLVTFLRRAPSRLPLDLPATIPKSTAEVIAANGSEVFSVTHGGGEGALPNPFIESKLKTMATTRNMNVIRDIVEKFGS
ncbi:MAG TPA: DUF1697 domain-containing protein [Nitrososphaerales archaeon]|nr:DUF1697 domain-containing protein [Nitrososphaerales archaeon]